MDTLMINGKAHPWQDGMTVGKLLTETLGETGAVVVELNGKIVQRESYEDTPLNKGDVVEIVHFVGGG